MASLKGLVLSIAEPRAVSKKEIEEYLDQAIRSWRTQRDLAATTEDALTYLMAVHYVDAFQSVRVSLLGSALAPEY